MRRAARWLLLLTGFGLPLFAAPPVGAPLSSLSGPSDELLRARVPRVGSLALNPGADTCDSAIPVGTIPPDVTEEGVSLDPLDHEWRTFQLTSPRLIRIETIGDPVDSDSNLTLYRACVNGVPGEGLAFNEDRSLTDYTSRIPLQGYVCLRASTYYVDVGSYSDLGTLAAFTLMIADGGPCTLPGSDRFEPDDTGATAKVLGVASPGAALLATQRRTIDPEGDLDFAYFHLRQPTIVRLEAGSDQNVNTVMGIADPAKNIYLAINDDASPGVLGSRIETCLPPGAWVAGVVARAFPDVFPYELSATAVGPCAFETESNDTLSRAQTFPLRFGKGTIYGRIDTTLEARDVDVYRFRAPSRRGVTISTGGYDAFDVDTRIELFDEAGTSITVDDDGGNGWLSRIERNLEPGTYFVAVAGSSFELPFGDAWTYSLTVALGEPFGEEQEPNDDCSQGSPVRLGTRLLAAIEPIGDVDHYRVDVGGSAIGGVLLDLTVTSLGDPFLRLYDDPPACTSQIGCDDDSGPGLDPRLTCCVPASSSYSVEVRDYQDNHAIAFYSLDAHVLGECIWTGACPVQPGQLGCNVGFTPASKRGR